ncbi:MAG: hypothetical protein FJX62_15635 [Alphaproteobacteria bacterium]|nr:hypothetical protein [Alphaproteobacteria bacterium]
MAATKTTIDLREFRRLALWGASAAAAVAILVFALLSAPDRSRTGHMAAQNAPSAKSGAPKSIASKPAAPQPPQAFDAQEGERLAATVRTLTEDRERLLARIATLERNLEDVTGSIARVQNPPPSPTPADPQPAVAAPDSVPAPPPATSPAAPAAAVAIPAPSRETPQPADATAPAEFGIDIGRAATVEGLRALWTSARSRHAAQLEGLRPVVFVQEGDRRGRNELRLLAGPIASAAAAARLCAAISAAGAACRPVVWDNQRLALK